MFIAEVQRCTEAIVAHPDGAPIVRGQIRRRCAIAFRMVCWYSTVGRG